MKNLNWNDWSTALPDLDLCVHPAVIAVARVLVNNPEFMLWLGHEHPVMLPLEPIAMITAAALIRVRNRFGKWDQTRVRCGVSPEKFDDAIGVPGLLNALWSAGIVESTESNAVYLHPAKGLLPKAYDFAKRKDAEAERERRLAEVRLKTLAGLSSPTQ